MMSHGSLTPVSIFAVAALFSIILGPFIGFLAFGLLGSVAATVTVLITILLLRSLFVTPARAGIVVAGLSLTTIVGAIALLKSVFPMLAHWVGQLKSARGCELDGQAAICKLPNVPVPTNVELWSMAAILVLAVIILNMIWFGPRGLLPAENLAASSADPTEIGVDVSHIVDFAADGTVLSADHVGELGAAIRTGKLLIAKDPSEVVTTPRIILGSSLDKSIRRKLRDHSATVPRQVPSPPSDFQGRTAVVEQLITALLAARDGNVAAVRGMGGIGKTTVAALVADQMEIAFPDGTVWVNGFGTRAGVRPSPDDTIGRVIHTIDPVSRLADTLEEKRATYVSLLRHRRCLIVVDDVADSEIPSLLTPTEPSALIVTSRRRFALPGLHTIDLPPLLAEEALAFVQTILLSSDRKMSRDEVMELVHRCACLPLALRAAGAFLSENPGWKTRDYLNLLGQTRNRLDALQPEDAELNVRRILGFSYDRLEEQDARLAERWRFLTLIPASFDDVAAAAVWDCSVHEARDSLANLRRRTLLEFDRGSDRYRFHDLMRDLAEEVLTKHDEAPRV